MQTLLRTSSFRLTILYAALFLASGAILFALVSWSINRATTHELQRDADDEMNEVKASAGTLALPVLQRVITDYAARAEGTRYLLQDQAGHVLAGNMAATAPLAGPSLIRQGPKATLIRGRGRLLADGYLFVGVEDHQTPRLRAAITRAFIESLASTILLALSGGAFMSINVLRRVDAISRASRDIMAGDLGRRIGLNGSNDEFDQLSASLNAMLDRIQSLMAGLQQVSSDIAHDLRTPLTRMRQRLDLALRRLNDPTELREAMQRSIADLDSILATFSALLRIAQVQSGARRSEFTRVDMSELVAQLVEAYQPVAEERSQTLDGPSSGGPAPVRGDKNLLIQLGANLIENAIRHCPQGAKIEIGLARTPDQLELIVADNGPGIPAALRSAVRARFFRLLPSRTIPGTGLGLALVSAIAELHDAELQLRDNAPGLRACVALRPMDETD